MKIELNYSQILGLFNVLNKLYETANSKNDDGKTINKFTALELLRIKGLLSKLKYKVDDFNTINEKIVIKYAMKDENDEVIKKISNGQESVTIDNNNVEEYNKEILEVLKDTKIINIEKLGMSLLEKIDNISGPELDLIYMVTEKNVQIR